MLRKGDRNGLVSAPTSDNTSVRHRRQPDGDGSESWKAELKQVEAEALEPKQPESKRREPKQTESKQPEPKQPEPKQPEPKQPDPKQPDPKQPDPKQPEPKQPEPKQPEPKQPEPKKPEPKHPEPKQPEPKKPEPKHPEPKQPEPKQPESPRPEAKLLDSEPSVCPAPNTIEEELVSPEEYALLTTAVLCASASTPTALSAFLTQSHAPTASTPFPALRLTLRPRPRFPAPLHAALLPYATALPRHSAVYEDLHFPLHAVTRLRDLLNAAGHALPIPPVLLAAAANLPALLPPTLSAPAIAAALSPHPWAALHPFQRVPVVHAVAHLRGRVLLADAMGLGKTLQALCIAQYYRLQPAPPAPVLVLCPSTLRAAWQVAVPRWLRDVPPAAVHAPATAGALARLLRALHHPPRDPWDVPPPCHFLVLSYDLLPRVAQLLAAAPPFRVVIADEAHTLRNVATARAAAALPLLHAATRRILISGTPALSRPAELYPLLCALLTKPEVPFLSHAEFVARYTPHSPGAANALLYGDELNLLLSSVMIRRGKDEVTQELPPKTRRLVEVELGDHLVRPLASVRDQLDELAKGIADPSTEPGIRHELAVRKKNLTASLFHKTAYLKIPAVVARVRQLLREGDSPAKMLVFAHHLHVLDAVEAFVDRESIDYVRIDGSTPAKERNVLVATFQEEESVRVAVLSLAVAGTGLTLTAADVVLFAELSWVPSVLAQAEDRAHRLGRVGPVMVEYLFAAGTVDEMMWATVKSKLNVLNKTVDGSRVKRKESCDVSLCAAKKIRISELDMQALLTDTIDAIEAPHGDHSSGSGRNPCPETTDIPAVQRDSI